MRFKHIIWDYDGTLFDTYPIMSSVYHDVLRERGITEPTENILSYMKVSMGHVDRHYKELYNLDDSFFERYKTVVRKAENENTKPFTGIIKLCHDICKNGGRNYVFTHRDDSALYVIEKYKLTGCFTEIITSNQNFPRKPDPGAVIYLINKYGFPVDEAIMIGDREIDLLSGKNAGTRACYFADSDKPLDIADFTINNFSELYKIIGIDEK